MLRTIDSARQDFPLINHLEHHAQAYLDSAATSQKPEIVLQAVDTFYRKNNANPRRGISHLAHHAEVLFEQARISVAEFIHAQPAEIVFTKSTTESLNIVAVGWAQQHLKAGDEIVLSEMEHHSNLIPWQIVARKTDCTLKFIPVNETGIITVQSVKKLLTNKTKLIAITHVSNVFGTTTPLAEIIRLAHDAGAIVVVDGAQAVAHYAVDVKKLDADFYAFSSHKLYGPAGVGILYGKQKLLEQTEPVLYGGSMIEHVTFTTASWDKPPYKFEGGTQAPAEAHGLASAITYLQQFRWADIQQYESALVKNVITNLQHLGVKVYAPQDHAGSIVSFNIPGVHPHDASEVIDACGVSIRAGHHCAEPLMTKLEIPGTLRASFGIYNNQSDADKLIGAVEQVIKRFGNG